MFELIRRLSRRHRIDVVSFGEGDADEARAGALAHERTGEVRLVPPRPDRRPDWLGLRPTAVADYYDPAMARTVARMLATGRYDLLQIEYTAMGAYAPARRRLPALWTVHELWCARLRRELARRRGPVRVLIAYRFLQMLRWELGLTRRFDLVLALAEPEADELRRRGARARVAVSPMGVDTSVFTPAPAESAEAGLIVFIAFYGHAPNVDAARWLAGEVLPRVRARAPRAHLALVGREPTPAVTALAAPGVVEVTGAVPDVRPWLDRAQVVVVPVREGGGMRGKVLEAWASARAVVSTRLGCAGLPAEDGANALLADDAETMATQIVRLLDDPGLRRRLGDGGRATVRAAYDWDAIAEAHAALYAELLPGSAA
jgi:glycosyltransferase involved in cell wall biosynthesis